MICTYTAKRNIQSGHSAGTDYSVDFELSALDRFSDAQGAEFRTVGGDEVTTLYNTRVGYSVASVVIETNGTPSVADMREFLDSVKGREPFTVNDGSTTFQAVLKSLRNPYRETLLAPGKYRYSFEMVVV